jgi:hypothetical protein
MPGLDIFIHLTQAVFYYVVYYLRVCSTSRHQVIKVAQCASKRSVCVQMEKALSLFSLLKYALLFTVTITRKANA